MEIFDSETNKKVVTSVVIFFLTTLASFVIGRSWGKYKANRDWSNKHFLGRVIVSLNVFSDGFLKIRTIFERSLEDVFINSAAVAKVLSASKLTRQDQPILPIAKEDRWFLLNFVLNAVSEEFNQGLVHFDAGQPLRPVTYLICLTCEAVGPDRIRKVRAMMIRKDLLLNLPAEIPKLEQPWHADRFVTLNHCAKVYRTEPDNFLELEVYV
ncbi:MAG: hypothetical protein K2R98_05635 [Gemmataceae bacterium]|nr:hypothetical protein [Gemmataceae bacterium]